MTTPDIFNHLLPAELADDLRRLNPHWYGKPGPETPRFTPCLPPKLDPPFIGGRTSAAVVRGTGRVGKTVLLRQIMEQLASDGIDASRILYVPFDEIESLRNLKDPILNILRWYESQVLRITFNQSARAGKTVFVL